MNALEDMLDPETIDQMKRLAQDQTSREFAVTIVNAVIDRTFVKLDRKQATKLLSLACTPETLEAVGEQFADQLKAYGIEVRPVDVMQAWEKRLHRELDNGDRLDLSPDAKARITRRLDALHIEIKDRKRLLRREARRQAHGTTATHGVGMVGSSVQSALQGDVIGFFVQLLQGFVKASMDEARNNGRAYEAETKLDDEHGKRANEIVKTGIGSGLREGEGSPALPAINEPPAPGMGFFARRQQA